MTSNHIHLLVKDTSPNVIAQSMQLIADRTVQEYNQRKGRQGAFWEDHYHATLSRRTSTCIAVFIHRLGIVRGGGPITPLNGHSGYREIQEPPERYAIIDLRDLMALCGFAEVVDFKQAHR